MQKRIGIGQEVKILGQPTPLIIYGLREAPIQAIGPYF